MKCNECNEDAVVCVVGWRYEAIDIVVTALATGTEVGGVEAGECSAHCDRVLEGDYCLACARREIEEYGAEIHESKLGNPERHRGSMGG